jgi:hypothetical protein
MTKITKRAVDAIRASGREMFLWDDETAGFGLRAKPSGAKSFIVQYGISKVAAGALRSGDVGS